MLQAFRGKKLDEGDGKVKELFNGGETVHAKVSLKKINAGRDLT